MGLRAALVDRAYRIRKSPSGEKVEGTTIFAPAESEAIPARLTLSTAAERNDDGRTITEPQPTLIVYRRDLLGEELDWKATDRIRVESQQLGNHEFEVQGDPQPMRKKRRIIGWTITLRRTDEHDAWGPNRRQG